jgi:hypothetical protein
VGGLALLLALTGSAVALTGTVGSSPANADEVLPAFDDCDALTSRMQELALPYVGEYGFHGGDTGGIALDGRAGPPDRFQPPVPGSAPAAAAPMPLSGDGGDALAGQGLSSESTSRNTYAGPDEAVGPGRTGTNLQEAGVDEPDVAKTNGRQVYSLDGGSLRIVDVATDLPRSRGSLDLADLGLSPTELLLDGDRLLVIGTATRDGGRGDVYSDPASSYLGGTAALGLVDVGDPDAPRLVGMEEITGRHVSARLTDGVARVVVTSTPELRFLSPGAGRSARETARTYNRDVVRLAEAEDWLPARTIIDGSGHIVGPAAPLVDCADVRYPTRDSGIDMLSVLSIDLGRDDALTSAGSTAVVATGDLVYASPHRLYVATTGGGWGRSAPGADGSGTTTVHEFDLGDPLEADYLSSGTVEGYIPGRWAMSEYDGALRVVTTTQEPWREWNGGTESQIVVLQPRRGRLVEVGRVGGLGRGETVRAVRWFDELAAVVTFRQTDPLYLVDMSVPERPQVRGRLKIPGYSAYLHPIGDHRLLGVGQDATETGQERGLQISSFDIADASDPQRVDAVGYGPGSSSAVQTDPRGFVYLADRRTAVLPAQLPIRGPGCDFECYRGTASGLISVRVSEDGDLSKGGSWRVQPPGTLDDRDRAWSGEPVTKVLSLPGGRLAALDGEGVSLLDADTLDDRGSTRYGDR